MGWEQNWTWTISEPTFRKGWENSHRSERKQWGFFSISNSLGYHVEYHWSSRIDSIEPRAAKDDHECDQRRQAWLIPIAAERVGVQVELWNPSRTRAIPERFCGGDSLRRGAISSVCTFTFTQKRSTAEGWLVWPDVIGSRLRQKI